jgi:hypothetical protein
MKQISGLQYNRKNNKMVRKLLDCLIYGDYVLACAGDVAIEFTQDKYQIIVTLQMYCCNSR